MAVGWSVLSSWRALAGVTAAVGVICLSASAAGAQPDGAGTAQREPSTAVNATMVLLRIDIQIADKHVPPSQFSDNGPQVYLANIDRRQEPQRIRRLEQLPGAAGSAGWIQMALEPGTYFLLVVPPGMEQNPPATAYHAPSARFGRMTGPTTGSRLGGRWDGNLGGYVFSAAAPSAFLPLSGFLLRVPARASAVYVGTLRVICTSGRGLFGNLIDVCSDISVSNEEQEAALAARTLQAAPERLQVSLVSRYGSPMAPLDLRGSGLELVAVGFLAEPATMELAKRPDGPVLFVVGSDPAIAAFNVLMFVAREAGRASARMEAQQREEKWRPCIDRIGGAARELDVMKMVEAARTVAFAPLRAPAPGADEESASREPAQSQLNYALMIAVSPRYITLRECASEGEFCLELAMRVLLRDSAAERDVFDGVLAYSAARWPVSTREAWYLLPAQTRGRCRPIEAWCGEGGAELLRTEAAAAVGAIVDDAVRRSVRR
jgi:hypothetical protein